MSSAILEYLDKLDTQWEEIDRLTALASTTVHDIDTYNSLCRAATMLCVSHLEGFYKDTVKYYLSDMSIVAFKDLPKAMQRTFCQKFLGKEVSKESNERIEYLIKEFESHGLFKLSEDAFLPHKNKNPKPSILESVCESLGAKKIFSTLEGTVFDNVFSMTNGQIERVTNLLNKKVKRRIKNFPCFIDDYIFNKKIKNPGINKDRTLWEEFLDDLNTRRHDIAHGNNFLNGTSVDWIKTAKNKCRILQLICILKIASSAIPSNKR